MELNVTCNVITVLSLLWDLTSSSWCMFSLPCLTLL